MVSFIYYDLGFLVLFSIFVALFLYKNKKKLQIESKIILLYRTTMGLDTIDYIGNKHPKLLNFLSNFVVAAGYLMMGASIALLASIIYLMFKAAVLPKIPPLIPLLPYIDKILPAGLVPPFYFTYWIIVIAVVAVFHEFAHGVFAKITNVKIKSTGFGFIGPLLAAFVEIDEKQMEKKPIKSQLAVLAAGSTANLILWFMFFLITSTFFTAAFMPAGVNFKSYMAEEVNFSEISLVNNQSLSRDIQNVNELIVILEKINKSVIEIKVGDDSYFTDLYSITSQRYQIDALEKKVGKLNSIYLYVDSPAFLSNLSGAIQEISCEEKTYKITDLNSLYSSLGKLEPNCEAKIKTTEGEYSLILDEHPSNKSRGLIGISFVSAAERLVIEKSGINLTNSKLNVPRRIISLFSYKEPFVNYEPKGGSMGRDIIVFIYDLLYWLTLVNFFVMLFNMLPVGIVDGGRFFYLTMLGITKSKRKAFALFKLITWLIILLFLMIMVIWFVKAF